MKSIFDQETRDELINRVNSLNIDSKAQWGKMNVYQMVKHCTLWEDMMQGRQKYKRPFISHLFGKIALRSVMKDESPLRRNTPTLPELRISGDGDMFPERTKWISKIQDYAHFSDPGLIHPFFGTMTEEQIGYMVYKHVDHHLRQFGA
ncbi:DUF1569 domain-containing protein [Mucilaginibacter lappiensis]|uniref:DUF1569 domain-containing protein n=1 Tax=Mucilaginibacter lappiensis TaxID=354630 RepID=A0A1N7APZ7_9SPHI|nr:DUF1569 domain-containing protein [Mucilaginibacter lappiensis]MBB6110550.1 hypothetical protein [Mucilaginibacter lappiensis]MBB6131397.1 hypothetical protein [Mucilaginibacter lappiensis]SIR41068.1 Protein of unknown function [Mucilaginibacter lappiensis]